MSSQQKSCQLAEQFLQVLDDEVESLSEQTIETMQQQLVEAMSILRSTRNMRSPLLSLPVEVLAQITEEIPAIPIESASRRWSFPSYWSPRLHDSSLLVPLSRTCRRLRNISLSRSHYWRHINFTDDAPIPSLLVRSGDSPLSVIVDGLADTGAESFRLPAVYPSMAPRVRELHLLRVRYDCIEVFKTCLDSDLVHPELGSLSCCADDPTSKLWRGRRLLLVLDHDHFPRVRHIVLEGITFRVRSPLPSLTHLVLSTIRLQNLHVRIANLLLSTPNLISLVLSRLDDLAVVPPSTARTKVLLPHLRRITLHDLTGPSVPFSLSVTSHCADEAATQIVHESVSGGGDRFDLVLAERIKWQSAKMVGIDISHRSSPPGGSAQFSLRHAVTVASTVCALRLAAIRDIHDISEVNYRYFLGLWPGGILSDPASLEDVQEVWLSTSTLSGQHAGPVHGLQAAVRDIVSAMPALETIVLSATYGYNDQDSGGTACPSSLSCLPTILDQATFKSRKLRTLRIILCDLAALRTHRQSGAEQSARRPRNVDFTWMLEELASSAYCYLETLVLQTTPGFPICESDLSQLREYFATVSLEEIREPQRMPLPQCCVEEDDGPGGSRTWTDTVC